MRYNLDSSMSDRINFDEQVQIFAEYCLKAVEGDEASKRYILSETDTYIEDTWNGGDGYEVDDLAEAKARFFGAFREAIANSEWLNE